MDEGTILPYRLRILDKWILGVLMIFLMVRTSFTVGASQPGLIPSLRTDFAMLEAKQPGVLLPVGAKPGEAFATETVFDEVAQSYRFTYRGNDTIIYVVPLQDWSLQHGLLRVQTSINSGPEFSPVAWAGPSYRNATGEVVSSYKLAVDANTAMTSHTLNDNVVLVSYAQAIEGAILTRNIELRLIGRTLEFHIYGGSTVGRRNYAGFDFDRSENTPNWHLVDIPFLPESVVAFGGCYFYTTYLDRTLSHSIQVSPSAIGYSPTSVYAGTISRNVEDSSGHVPMLDETGYITVSPDVYDVLPKPAREPSSFRADLGHRVVLDLWRNDGGHAANDSVQLYGARIWVSPTSGSVHISGNAHDADPNCGDGVVVRILDGGLTLWAQALENGDITGINFELDTDVVPGSQLIFRIEQRENNDCDSTYFNPTIVLNSIVYSAASDFRNFQGYHNWYYRELDNGIYHDLHWDTHGYWQGSATWTRLWADGGHPGIGEGNKTWTKAEGFLFKLHEYGLEELAVIYHTWQRYGYDTGLPTHYPANPAWGTADELHRLVVTARSFGWLFAFHENYMDMYPSSPDFDPTAIAKTTSLSWVKTWLNPETGEQAYAIAANRWLGFADKEGCQIALAYEPNAAYLDVHTAWQPSNSVDMDATNPAPKTWEDVMMRATTLFTHQRIQYGGPLLGEGGEGDWRFDTFYAGLVDAVERQIEGREKAKVMPDYELLVIKPLMANHGLGYYGRYFVPEGQAEVSPSEQQWDQYRATEIAYGHAGFISDATLPGTSPYPMGSLEQLLSEYYLLQPLQMQYMTAVPVRIRYRSGSVMLTLSEAILAELDFQNAQIETVFDNGLVISVNRHASEVWTVNLGGEIYTLPPSGWAAYKSVEEDSSTDTLREFSARLADGTRGDYVRWGKNVFARSRDGVLRTIRDVETDGIAALIYRKEWGCRDIHLLGATRVDETGTTVVLHVSQRATVNFRYINPFIVRIRATLPDYAPSHVNLTYGDAPAAWRHTDGCLPLPNSGKIQVWALDEADRRVGNPLSWSTSTGKEMTMQLWAGQNYEIIFRGIVNNCAWLTY